MLCKADASLAVFGRQRDPHEKRTEEKRSTQERTVRTKGINVCKL